MYKRIIDHIKAEWATGCGCTICRDVDQQKQIWQMLGKRNQKRATK